MIFDYSQDKTLKGKDSVDIIDGQQRFTTILILLVACRQYAKEVLNSSSLVTSCQRAIDAGDDIYIDPKPKLLASASIRAAFENICRQDWDGNFPDSVDGSGAVYQNRRVKPIYDACLSEIRSIGGDGSEERLRAFLNQLLSNSIIISIGIDEQSEAFEIFERTNARGKDLAVEDLLKNFLYSKDNTAEISTREAWDKISDNAGNSMLRMLKYFWNSRGGYTSTKALYRKLKQYHGKMTTDQFVEELLEFSIFYKAFSSDDTKDFLKWVKSNISIKDSMYLQEIGRVIGALKLFRVTQATPLIFSIFKSVPSKNIDSKSIKRLITFLRLLESYHFINNKVCNRVGNEVEKLYQQYSKKVFTEKSPYDVMTELSSKLIEKMAQEDEFVAKFRSLTYAQQNERLIIKYTFDKLVNVDVKPGARKDLIVYDEIFQGIKPAYDIEHILSQSSVSEEDDYVHEIGNLTIIPRQINGILGNIPVKEKVDKLLNPETYPNNIKHVDDYVKVLMDQISINDDWNEKTIRHRTNVLAKTAYNASANKFRY